MEENHGSDFAEATTDRWTQMNTDKMLSQIRF
jgi:hypothetical protein